MQQINIKGVIKYLHTWTMHTNSLPLSSLLHEKRILTIPAKTKELTEVAANCVTNVLVVSLQL